MGCTNPFCKSNIENKNKNYNDKEASKMIKLKTKQCKSFKNRDIIPLKYDNIKIIEEDEEEKKEFKQIHKQIIDAFTHWDILYESFLTDSTVTDKDVGIDFIELDRTFNAIMKRESLCKDAVNALELS